MKIFGLAFLLTISVITIDTKVSYAQCAMCTLNADQSVQNGNTQGKSLNKGILFLLAMPYVAIGAVGYLWYKKYRRKKVDVGFKPNPANLN